MEAEENIVVACKNLSIIVMVLLAGASVYMVAEMILSI